MFHPLDFYSSHFAYTIIIIFAYVNIQPLWVFSGGLVVKNLPSNAGVMGSIPGQGTKIPHATGQLSLHRNYWAHAL